MDEQVLRRALKSGLSGIAFDPGRRRAVLAEIRGHGGGEKRGHSGAQPPGKPGGGRTPLTGDNGKTVQ